MASVIWSLAWPAILLIGSVALMIGAWNESAEYFRFAVMMSIPNIFLVLFLVFDKEAGCHSFLKSKFPRLFKYSDAISMASIIFFFVSAAVLVLSIFWLLIKIFGPALLAAVIWCVDFIGKIVTIVDKLAA